MELTLLCDVCVVVAYAPISEGCFHAGLVPGNRGCRFLARLVQAARWNWPGHATK